MPHRPRRGAPRRSGGRPRRRGALRWRANELVQVALEALARLRRFRVALEVGVVDLVHVGNAERPGAALGFRGFRDIHGTQYAGGKELVLEHVARALLLVGDEALPR